MQAELDIDRSTIAVSGESAGVDHAASLAIHARDRNEVPIVFQLLIYPSWTTERAAPVQLRPPLATLCGFVCIVGRSWTSAADADFWDTRVRVPTCVNAAAARTYLLRVTRISELILAGRTQVQMNEALAASLAKKELPPMEPGAVCYMMSKQGFGGDTIPHWPSHLMFFYSDTDLASWGANLPGSPVVGVNDPLEHLTQFVIVVQRWSDGTDYHEGSGAEHHL